VMTNPITSELERKRERESMCVSVIEHAAG
jgi:hypothetical protein